MATALLIIAWAVCALLIISMTMKKSVDDIYDALHKGEDEDEVDEIRE